MHKTSRILIVGHGDIIENSLYDYFDSHGFRHVLSSSRSGLNTLSQARVHNFFKQNKPEFIFLSSVRSGGIEANQRFAAEFIYENLESQNNIIHAAYKTGTKKLVYFTGSCAYPKQSPQPIKEKYLLAGPLEPTSEPYSIAKIAGTKLCQVYNRQYGFRAIVLVPATVYGPGSDTQLTTAHVMGALIGKFYEAKRKKAKEVVVWGTGRPRREFIYKDDFVGACLFLADHYNDSELVNVGCGVDVSIQELAGLIKEISGFRGRIVFDRTKPDGTMAKLMDSSRIKKLGWKPRVNLKEGIRKTYQWYELIKNGVKA